MCGNPSTFTFILFVHLHLASIIAHRLRHTIAYFSISELHFMYIEKFQAPLKSRVAGTRHGSSAMRFNWQCSALANSRVVAAI